MFSYSIQVVHLTIATQERKTLQKIHLRILNELTCTIAEKLFCLSQGWHRAKPSESEVVYWNTFYIGPFISVACGIEVRIQEQYFLKHKIEKEGQARRALLEMQHKLPTAMQYVRYWATLLLLAHRLGELSEAWLLPAVELNPHLLGSWSWKS